MFLRLSVLLALSQTLSKTKTDYELLQEFIMHAFVLSLSVSSNIVYA